MEKVLVAIDGGRGAWAALSHACSLAKRIRIELNVLLIQPRPGGTRQDIPKATLDAVKHRLTLHLQTAKAEGIAINYFMTEGEYEEEVVNFVQQHKIALLVYETLGRDAREVAKDAVALRALRHRLNCKMEVVAPIKPIAE